MPRLRNHKPTTRIGIALQLAAVLALGLAGCTRQTIELQGTTHAEVDFSGQWEVNYQLSERIQENVELLRLMAINQARRRGDYRWLAMPSFELVRLAESIARSPTLEIAQNGDEIEIRRQDDFPLTCTFGAELPEVEVDPLGSEQCGWDLHQLVFAFRLEDGLRVVHRFTLGPAGDRLNMATTVRTHGHNQEFTLNRVYTRYRARPSPYECRHTVDRGKVCWAGDGQEKAAGLE